MKSNVVIGIVIVVIIAVIGVGGYFLLRNNNDNNLSNNNSSNDDLEDIGGNYEMDGGNVLVVYYSATGSTKKIAEEIAESLNADIFEIVPVDVYSSADLDWNDDNSRVTREYEDESLRNVELETIEVANWDSYDTVFIGYPIWWGVAAWPVNTFVEANDFSGKIVIPFCTSASSGLGQSGELLANLAGEGNWLKGKRFRSGASSSDVQTWIDSLK